MSEQLDAFRNVFLGASDWAQRKEGIPLYLIDQLSPEELAIAEAELIDAAQSEDSWPITALGHMGSKKALPKLYSLLNKSEGQVRLVLAHSIFKINQDEAMLEVVLNQIPKIAHWSQLIDLCYMLPDFKDEKATRVLQALAKHPEFLVTYHAKKALEKT